MSEYIELFRKAVCDGSAQHLLDKPTHSHTFDYAAWRFLKALHDNPNLGSDHAVLLRQAVRWSSDSSIFVGNAHPNLLSLARKAGVNHTFTGNLEANPYNPSWLRVDRSLPDGIDSS